MQHKVPPPFSPDFPIFPPTLSALQNAERSPTYDKQAKNPTMRKSYRKCPDVLHGPRRHTPDPYAQERISAHIRQGKRTVYTCRGKRLISKINLLEFLGVADDEAAIWAGKILPREYSKGVK